MLLWYGRPACPFWTGGTPIPQTCVNYLIHYPESIAPIFDHPILAVRNFDLHWVERSNPVG